METGYFDWADGSESKDAASDNPEEENEYGNGSGNESGNETNTEGETPVTYSIGPDGQDTASDKKCQLTVKTINELHNSDQKAK